MSTTALATGRFAPVVFVGSGCRRRGYQIVCSGCGTRETVRCNTLKNGCGRDNDIFEQLVSRKFKRLGWRVGRNSNQDLCMKCAVAGKTPHLKLVEKPSMEAVNSRPGVVAPEVGAAPPVREMSADDALTILGKLQDVYIDKDKGYDRGWTDAKVALDLNVPRAWVSQVRVKFYGAGAAGNDEITEALEEGRRIVKEGQALMALLDQIKALAAKATGEEAPLKSRLERIERALDSVENSLRRG